MKQQVIIYSADWCAFCRATKEYLTKLNVAFEERNVESKPEYAQEAVEKSKQTGIPVLDIDGIIIVGFDRARIDETLKEKKLVD